MSDTLPVVDDPIALFEEWLAEAALHEPNDPNAMAVATATPDGRPSVRMLLLKGVDARGFVFYTNTESRKGGELLANDRVALLFHWKSLRRQVRVEGPVRPVTDAEADEYFNSRSRLSRIGALASDQSRPLSERSLLQKRVEELDRLHPGEDVPRPPHWRGFRLVPEVMEFWQDMPYRLHDRLLYRRDGAGWDTTRLYP
ncbi:pyridoxamine 5'-phosphate oxidase [Rhizosaccharibacter radicis]|uniref:Pyridoxine/pyridoxamine 5'-phosphate oxidase n=1 Tax=Rhizosaccharibacter radicis TaxID=2782605 RepID=A0ABT1VVR4_9PROT|nr:pyridoxamine 5'-phosphate oxidase [Acetobacteraceae bacterium KSS12]